ncbi:MAG: UvrD-helicase domain-containing protein [Bacteroidetes bacterium]|nr:UvrD-helicase domain-containing protein [Bacteroidota bacterium]
MLTQSQERALTTSHHLSVTANAGSGKTLVLVERYIDILVSGKARVKEVVAITFTEKAAGELKRKIADGIGKRIASSPDRQTRNTLEEIREQLSGAVVDTIHSFCSKILREYPVEAGVDAAFTVLEVVDQQVLLEAAIKETFDSILKEGESHAGRQRLFEVLRALGKFKVLDIVHTLALKREQVERWILPGGLYERTDDDVLAFWRSYLSAFVKHEFEDPLVLRDLQALVNAATPNSMMSLRPRFSTFKHATALHERLQLFAELLEAMLTQKGELRKKVFGDNSNIGEQAERLRKKFKSLSPLIDFVTHGDDSVHRILLQHSRVLLELYQNAVEHYEGAKLENAYLDFEDLQIRTKNLLRDERIRRKLSQRYRFIMVDEYQDTNTLQYEILLPLMDNLSGGNLFIVGDPKQSIYGFRNADVAVFNQTKREIEESAGHPASVVLADSFRLLRDIAAFVNLMFEPLMKGENGKYEVSYEPLVQGRQNKAPGRVELIVREPSIDEEENKISEGELIARRIIQLRSEPCQVFSKEENSRSAGFSDFAILLRSRTGLSDLEDALIRHGIPYLVSSGVGYFQTQGIYDFYNYFRFLLNTDDDVALAGILRSPFYNVSDAELYELSLDRRGGSFWNLIASGKGKAKQFTSVVRAVSILAEHTTVATRLPVPEIVNRIVNDTAYAGFVAGTPRAEQTFANLEKLKRFARSYEQQGFTTLYDFVGRLKRLIEQEEKEGQASVDVLADAVRIMTIHAAKGLEFPIVIVPGLDRTFRYDNEPFLDDELGLGFTQQAKTGDDRIVPIAEFLKRNSRAKMIAEEKRIFYVACTRARDMLILSGAVEGNRSTDHYMNWLLNGIGVGDVVPKRKISFDRVTEYLHATANGFKRSSQRHKLDIHVLRPADLARQSAAGFARPAPAKAERLMIDPLPPGVQGEIFSASKIRTYVDCPSKYYLRYVAGLPAAPTRLYTDQSDEELDTEIPADLRGRAFHHLMQYIDDMGTDKKSAVTLLKDFIARDSYSILSEPSIELESLAETALKVIGTDFWNSVKSGAETRTEFTIMAAFGKDFLVGTLDRIFRDSQGIWHVLDYKTDSLSNHTVQQKAAQYEPQVKFYSLLVSRHSSSSKVHAHLLFAERPEEPVDFSYGEFALAEFENELSSIIQKIHAREFTPDGRIPCSGCPFLPNGCSALFS